MATRQTLGAIVTEAVRVALNERFPDAPRAGIKFLTGQTGIAERTLYRRLAGSPWTTDEIDAVATALGMEDATPLLRPCAAPPALLPGNGGAK